MKIATYNGRLQKITRGRIADLTLTFNLACNPQIRLNDSLLLYKDGQHEKAQTRATELEFLGKLDGIIIGLACADHPLNGPETIRPEWEQTAHTFFDPNQNPLTYFQRMALLKQLITEAHIPIEKVDIIPKFPHHYYPSLENAFEDPDAQAVQYLGVENNHHFMRIQTKGPEERNIIVLYHDYRNIPDEEKARRDQPAITQEQIKSINTKNYLVHIGSVTPTHPSITEKENDVIQEAELDDILARVDTKGTEAVLVLPHKYPLCHIRNTHTTPEQITSVTPIAQYYLLKKQLLHKGADLTKVHITFLLYDEACAVFNLRRQNWCMPPKLTNY